MKSNIVLKYAATELNKVFPLPSVPDGPKCLVPQLQSLEGAPQAHIAAVTSFVPELKDYTFDLDSLRMLHNWWTVTAGAEEAGFFLYGPTGSGKTSRIEQAFARMGCPLPVLACSSQTELSEWLVRPVVSADGGGTLIRYEYGPLALAAKYGFPVLLDEVDRLKPTMASELHKLMDGGKIIINQTGEVITPAFGFRFLGTGNTAMGGDDADLHIGAQRQDAAFPERWIFVLADYPAKATEVAAILQKVPGFKEQIAGLIVDVANSIRGAYIGNPKRDSSSSPLDVPLSTRQVIRIARWATVFVGTVTQGGPSAIQRAFEHTILPRASKASQDAILAILRAKEGTPTPKSP